MSAQQSAISSLVSPSPSHSQANPIDLTLDDEDEDLYETDRKTKRMCSTSRNFNASCASPFSPSLTRFQPYQSTGLSPAMATQSLVDSSPQPSLSTSASSPSLEAQSMNHLPQNPVYSNWPPSFDGPSDGAAFFHPRALATPRSTGDPGQTPTPSTSRQVIDLTRTPSPAPAPQFMQSGPMSLPQDLSPRTPVCIGQLVSTALILYPVPYLQSQESASNPDPEWAPVRFSYEQDLSKPTDQDTVHIKTLNIRSPTGEVFPSENFGVLAQKVATHLGPLLGKGLIRLDGKVRRGIPNVSD